MRPAFLIQLQERIIRYWSVFFIAITAALVLFPLLRFADAVAAFFEDDFFYYLQIARNIAEHGKSTFDGSIATNGYHPLWMVVLSVLWKATGKQHFFAALFLLLALLSMATCFLTCRVLTRLGLPRGIRNLASLLTAWVFLYYARTGMEIVLTVPLVMLLIEFLLGAGATWSKSRCCLSYGLLASLIILSRLDAIFLVAVVLTVQLSITPWPRDSMVRAVCFSLGGLLLPLYFCFNYWQFGTILPISGEAKHLEPGIAFSAIPIASLFRTTDKWTFFTEYIPMTVVATGLVILVLRAVMALSLSATDRTRLAFLVFPFLHLAILSFVSDWILWKWYLYPFIIAMPISISVICESLPGWQLNSRWVESACVGCSCLLAVIMIHSASKASPEWSAVYATAKDLDAFAATHPGRYAMGDWGGTAGYVMSAPLLQLEGLVEDKKFLNNIKEQRNLLDVLRDYHVQYYITNTTSADGNASGCFEAVEPSRGQAGPRSPTMRGSLCQPPVAVFVEKDVCIHGPCVVRVFKLEGNFASKASGGHSISERKLRPQKMSSNGTAF